MARRHRQHARRVRSPELPLIVALCKIGAIPDQVSAQVPVVPDHELLRVIGRGAYGEIWMARTVIGGLRAVKIVYRSTFESERIFLREFEGMSAFEPISRGHAGFVDILHVGRTTEHLYYSMELADDHIAGRKIDILNYEPRTLKSDLARHKRLSADESIQLGLSLTEALEALHQHGLTHRDIKPSNIIFIDGIPKLADIGLVAVSGQQSFVGTEGYVPPEGPGTAQSDVFSLGKLLYEVSTGKDRLDFPEIDSQLSTRPDREQLLQLNDVLIKACAQDAKKRYRTAAEMNRDLAALEDGRRPARSKSVWPILAATISILALGVIAFSFYSWRRGSSPEMHLTTTIRTDPPGALVILGDHAEKSPATFEDLDQRKYRLRIMSPGYDPIETTVDLGALRAPQPSEFHLVRSKGGLQIESDPPGAQFSLRSEDGQISREGVTPRSIADLPTGKYSVALHRGNWEMRDQIEVQRGETARKSFAFVSAPVKITSEPTGAEIGVDGMPRGRTPLQIDLPATSHLVTAHIAGWPNEEQKIDIGPQQSNSAHFVFANGSVKITSAPGGATVRANGRELGQTPLVVEEVKPGDVTYELRLSGYNSTTVTGKVDPQQQTFLAARLEKSVGPAPGQPFTNSLGMKFVPIADIRVSIWETRVQDYAAFLQATGRRYEPTDF